MKKVFKAAFYLAWFAVPGLIVQYYSRNIDPMSPEEVRMATIAGTVAMIVLAVLTGFGRTGRRAAQPSVPKPSKSKNASGPKGFCATGRPGSAEDKDNKRSCDRSGEDI